MVFGERLLGGFVGALCGRVVGDAFRTFDQQRPAPTRRAAICGVKANLHLDSVTLIDLVTSIRSLELESREVFQTPRFGHLIESCNEISRARVQEAFPKTLSIVFSMKLSRPRSKNSTRILHRDLLDAGTGSRPRGAMSETSVNVSTWHSARFQYPTRTF